MPTAIQKNLAAAFGPKQKKAWKRPYRKISTPEMNVIG
jgi:hypothetical protein